MLTRMRRTVCWTGDDLLLGPFSMQIGKLRRCQYSMLRQRKGKKHTFAIIPTMTSPFVISLASAPYLPFNSLLHRSLSPVTSPTGKKRIHLVSLDLTTSSGTIPISTSARSLFVLNLYWYFLKSSLVEMSLSPSSPSGGTSMKGGGSLPFTTSIQALRTLP